MGHSSNPSSERTPAGASQGLAVRAQVRFAIVPEWLISADVPDKALRVYMALARRANNDDGTCYPSRETIAEDVGGCSVDTIDRCLKALAKIGAVTWEKRRTASGEPTSNLYTVMVVPVDNSGVGRNSAAQVGGNSAAQVAANLRPELDPMNETQQQQRAGARAEPSTSERLADYLASAIEEFGKAKPSVDGSWSEAMAGLLEDGARSASELRGYIDWVFKFAADPFWRNRIRHAGQFARSLDTIVGQIEKAKEQGSRPRAVGDDGLRPRRDPEVGDLEAAQAAHRAHLAMLVGADEVGS